MTPSRFLLAALAAACLSACGGGGGGGGASPVDPPVDGPGAPVPPLRADLVVQLTSGTAVADVATRYGLTVVDQFGKRPIWRLRVAEGADADAAVTALRADGGVQFAERTVESETPEGRKNSVWAIGGDAGVYAAQWAPQAIRLASAHAISTGRGVRVAVLDTGIDLAHPTLASRIARTGAGAVLGRDFVDDDADASEAGRRSDAGYGHGTHVAGLVALAAPDARLMPARVLDPQGRGNTWVLAEALAWAVDPDRNPASDDGAHVVNLSLGTLQRTELLRRAVALADCSFDDDDDDFADAGFDDDRARCALRHGAVVAAAAGNGGNDSELQFPAAEAVKGSIAVGASNADGRIAAFSNAGSWVQLAAPGEAIVSTVPGGGWGTWSGTSMAAPLVAGAAALVLATVPPGGDPGLPAMRQWIPELAAKRLTDRSAALCGVSLRQLDALAALRDEQAAELACP